MSNVFLVVGSAHLDVMGRITGDDGTVDKIGTTTIEIGGAACNIAVNLISLQGRVRLLTAMHENSPFSKIVLSYLKETGIDVRILNQDTLQAPVFSVHIGTDGDMLSAVSSMPVERAEFDDELIESCLEHVGCVILECNLSGKSLNQITRIANKKNIPVYISAVSEEKSLRMADITGKIAAAFFNRREANYFGRRIVANTNPRMIAERLDCDVVVTRDKHGALVIEQGEEFHVPPPSILKQENTLGAGDALLANTVSLHALSKTSLTVAVGAGVEFAGRIMERGNCNAGQSHSIEKAIDNLEQMATKDIMTGLTNRRQAEKILQIAQSNVQRTQTPYSILMVDIDHFKKVNDTYGHDVGDEAIKAVAKVLHNTVRTGDVACRWGGEEFVCILNGADEAMASHVAERMRSIIQETAIPVVEKVTVSIGVASWNPSVPDWPTLFKQADLGLYDAKHGGRNRIGVYREAPVIAPQEPANIL